MRMLTSGKSCGGELSAEQKSSGGSNSSGTQADRALEGGGTDQAGLQWTRVPHTTASAWDSCGTKIAIDRIFMGKH